MKIQNRLSLYSSLVFAVIFIIISALTCTIYYHQSKNIVYNNLKNNSLIIAHFFLEEDELNSEEFAKVRALFEEHVSNPFYQVYDENNDVSYGSQFSRISKENLDKVRKELKFSFSDEEFFCYGIFYEDNQGDFVVVTREKKDEIYLQLKILFSILFVLFIVGTIAIIILNKWISNIAYRPVRDIIEQVKDISNKGLEPHINVPPTKDELQDLVETFNDLLLQISETIVLQKNFVNYVSHEFKTPLAAMLGSIEVILIKDRQPEDYKRLCHKLIQQITQLEEILNTLIIISDLRNTTDVDSQIRIDELIWEITKRISVQYPNSQVLVDFQVPPEKEELLYVVNDHTQLLISLFNLIENAVKYSNNLPVHVTISDEKDKLKITIQDEGIGIPQEDLTNISKPFYRGTNTKKVGGSGIGLSIAFRILEKNKINYNIESKINQGTLIELMF